MPKNLLIQAWKVFKIKGDYYLPYTHWIYLAEVTKYFEQICLLSPVEVVAELKNERFYPLSDFPKIIVKEVSLYNQYIDAIKFCFEYVRYYRELSKVYETSYIRFPAPWGWVSKFFFKDKRRIIHFVGDPIDVIKHNPSLGKLKKKLLLTFFQPELWAYRWACKGAEVYTNGFHIAKKLKAQNINAHPLVSSTLKKDDFYYRSSQIKLKKPKFLYVGYLRKAKGVGVIIKAFSKVLKDYPEASLTLVGDGPFKKNLKKLAQKENISHEVTFAGHIDNREKLNEYYKTHDIFLFASYSEGSPRVVLEAMANSLPVISTPVGSLPTVFKENKEILFADFGKDDEFYNQILSLLNRPEKMHKMQGHAFKKAKDFTIERFIETIFSD